MKAETFPCKKRKKKKEARNFLLYNFSHFSNDLFDFEKFANFFRFEKSIDKAKKLLKSFNCFVFNIGFCFKLRFARIDDNSARFVVKKVFSCIFQCVDNSCTKIHEK